MPVKRTTAKGRRFVVTQEMVEAFRARDSTALHRLCDLRPWMPGIFDVDTPEPPAWTRPGDLWGEFWPQVREMREAIEKAARF